MKKFLLFIALLLAALSLVSCNAGTDGAESTTAHVAHSYGEWKTVKESTCTETGSEERTCECGSKEQREIPASHTEVTDPYVAPSKMQTGLTEGKHCSVCGEILVEQEIIPRRSSYGLEYTVNRDRKTCTITGKGKCADLYISIPTEIDGYTVTAIGDSAFHSHHTLQGVYIPPTVTTLEKMSFTNCSKLRKIDFSEGLVTIGEDAFLLCVLLESIDIPKTVTEIKRNAFASCDSLTSITIPGNVKSIGGYAFRECDKLKEAVISEGTQIIEDSVFYLCLNLTDVTFPDSLIRVGKNIFELTPFTMDKKHLENGALYVGKHLVYVDQETSGRFDIKEGTKLIAAQAFYRCYDITEVTVPDGLMIICEDAFDGCRVQSLSLPESVDCIYDRAFASSGIKSMTMPESLSFLGEDVFKSSSLYRSADNWEDGVLYVDKYLIEAKNTVVGKYTVKPGTVHIGKNAFKNSRNITEIVIPESVLIIDDRAFIETYLQKINLPASLKAINASVFESCYSLNGIVLPSGITFIGEKAFYLCNGLTEINIPDGVTHIGDYAFYGCSFTEVTLPESVVYLGSHGFALCEKLEKIDLSDNITEIGPFAFSGCKNLTEITLPAKLTYLGGSSFEKCESLTAVTFQSALAEINYSLFSGCKNLESISLPDGVINVWGSAFDSPTIKTLKLPASVKYMDKRIFSYQQFNGTIEYGGTVEMWNGIEKHEDWIESFQKATVVCTDGTVSYN